ncbi:unnamed protein product, partial [Closterium sp. NIES-64]
GSTYLAGFRNGAIATIDMRAPLPTSAKQLPPPPLRHPADWRGLGGGRRGKRGAAGEVNEYYCSHQRVMRMPSAVSGYVRPLPSAVCPLLYLGICVCTVYPFEYYCSHQRVMRMPSAVSGYVCPLPSDVSSMQAMKQSDFYLFASSFDGSVPIERIRNFSIIAHIDHGKSTLADKLLETTGTVQAREMKEQFLDNMELERERGITIKLQRDRHLAKSEGLLVPLLVSLPFPPLLLSPIPACPSFARGFKERVEEGRGGQGLGGMEMAARMRHVSRVDGKAYCLNLIDMPGHATRMRHVSRVDGKAYCLNLIDTPSHVDFSYEVSFLPSYHSLSVYCLCPAHLSHWQAARMRHVSRVDGKAYCLNLIDMPGHAARMRHVSRVDGKAYCLNLIDTPGHVDFSYEVSRSLAACEGALLVVDASQGVEAQTLANVYLAIEGNLEIIPMLNKIDLPGADPERVLNKIDLPGADPERVRAEVEEVVGLDASDAILCSAKEGVGIQDILESIIAKVPPPAPTRDQPLRCLIFDSYYDPYHCVIVYFRVVDGEVRKGDSVRFMAMYFRVVDGEVRKGDSVRFMASGKQYEVDELGVLSPTQMPVDCLYAGEVGYLAASIRQVADARVGDTITHAGGAGKGGPPAKEGLPGYREAVPMVFCGLFPIDADQFPSLREALEKLQLNDAALQFPSLREALEKLQLNDAALQFEPESSSAMGFGFRCGFLGLLHMDVVQVRGDRHSGMLACGKETKITARKDKERAFEAALTAVSGHGGAEPKAKKGRMEDWYGEGGKAAKRAADDAICLFITGTRLGETICQHPLFLNMLRAVNAAGTSYVPPKRGYVGGAGLLACKQQIEKALTPITKTWKETGMTIASDMMRDKSGRAQMNILCINASGAVFQEAVDCKAETKSGAFIMSVLQPVIEKVGPEHVVAICTDGGSNYVSAAKLLQKKYPHIEFVPCTTHVLDLLLEDFGSMAWAQEVVPVATDMISFIRSHTWTRAFLRCPELHGEEKSLQPLRPAGTRFGTQYIAVSRLREIRPQLTAMVTHKDWEEKGRKQLTGKDF